MDVVPFDPYAVAKHGREIYDRHRTRLEAEVRGKFAVVDVASERVFVGDSPEDAYRLAREGQGRGPFHVVRIGAASVYTSTRLPTWRRRRAH